MFREDDALVFQLFFSQLSGTLMSSVNYWEVLVGARRGFGQAGVDAADSLMTSSNIEVAMIDASLAREAADAFRRYRGRAGGRLNMRHCFAYALAHREGDGLLFKGNDFPRTDVKPVLTAG